MTVEKIKSELITLISDIFQDRGFDTDIIEYADLIDDMSMDSITFISVIVELEAKFGIIVPDDMLVMENFRNVDNITEIIEKELIKKENKQGASSDVKA